MNQTDKEAFREMMTGVAWGVGFLSVFTLFIAILTPSEIPPERKFEVVDRYRDCDVVRYTDPSNGWNYFLHCPVPTPTPIPQKL